LLPLWYEAEAGAGIGINLPTRIKNTIEIDLMPGGRNHCGGDFVLPHLQLQKDKMAGRMPLFVMAPGSIVTFQVQIFITAQLSMIRWNAAPWLSFIPCSTFGPEHRHTIRPSTDT
jgi:hypothetical protein